MGNDHTFVRPLRVDVEVAAFRTEAQAFVDKFCKAIRRNPPRPDLWTEFCTSTGSFPDVLHKGAHPKSHAQVFAKRAKELGIPNVSKLGSIPRDLLPERLQTS